METLYQFLSKAIPDQFRTVIDCHRHDIGWDGHSDFHGIHLVDNPIRLNRPLAPDFERFVTKENPKGIKGWVAAIGKDVEETKEIIKTHSYRIDAIGELKIFKHYVDRHKPGKVEVKTYYDDKILDDIIPLCGRIQVVLFHCDIINDIKCEKAIEGILNVVTCNPKIRFVWCHCGMNELDNKRYAHERIRKAMTAHPNLWTDISWEALPFYDAHPRLLAQLDTDRVLLGTDTNSSGDREGAGLNNDRLLRLFDNLSKVLLNNAMNLKNLFKEKM